ncbi:MAG: hypothetical protein LLG43_14610 [Deltaproteobacteria bacterium]|nr:hypothetical protein [Deltaproteobacteria bacterium]
MPIVGRGNNKMIFDLKDATVWDPVIGEGLRTILGNSYFNILKKNADKIRYRDSDSEACNLFCERASREKIRAEVIKVISHHFKEVMVYHACRPKQVYDYYEKGIIPLSPIQVQKQFRDNFSTYVSNEDIDAAIAAVSLDTRDGVVHVVLDDRAFVDSSGHYLIYGSEYQICLSINLPGAPQRMRDILKSFGKATVFVCRLPFSTVTDLEYLVPRMMADHFFRIAHNCDEVSTIDYTVSLSEAISPNAIIRHFCPIRIKDPYKYYAVWNDETMEYE